MVQKSDDPGLLPNNEPEIAYENLGKGIDKLFEAYQQSASEQSSHSQVGNPMTTRQQQLLMLLETVMISVGGEAAAPGFYQAGEDPVYEMQAELT